MKRDGNNRKIDSKYVHCAIMGDQMTRKTSISESFANHSFRSSYEATVFDNYVVPLKKAGEEFAISLFDISARENIESLRSFAYRESEVLLLCFSTVTRETFTNIKKLWMPELKRHNKASTQKRPVILVITKIDICVGNGNCEVTRMRESSWPRTLVLTAMWNARLGTVRV